MPNPGLHGEAASGSITAALARFDVDLEVIEPPELAQAFARLAERFRG
ncbi:WYL domain-containing protein [Microbacterium sp. zg.Y1090]|nr:MULTISPECIES: WYL domain-containing protein [unclassified Microbacterium]MCR2812922.1 WYL domain-containing protein [Microbacterium sp. zg.Y1084]MCR2817269.1 WYL domain-containing protein [Microbacterium sp. zg.Y1090]WIM29242.1 WYL domain-containing protein [Microbacterium sp. zg-Y1090]